MAEIQGKIREEEKKKKRETETVRLTDRGSDKREQAERPQTERQEK